MGGVGFHACPKRQVVGARLYRREVKKGKGRAAAMRGRGWRGRVGSGRVGSGSGGIHEEGDLN